MSGPGQLALIGGGEWQEGCDFDRQLLDASGAHEVMVLPTAAAYEHPDRVVESAAGWFQSMGATVSGLDVLTRRDAQDQGKAATVREGRFLYLSGGSSLHLRSVLKDSPVWEALLGAWQGGAVVAASAAGAMVLTDPMVDPRGGAFTVGLGMVAQLAVIPNFGSWSPEKAHRTVDLAPAGLPIAGIDERTALIFDHRAGWTAHGAGQVRVWVDGQQSDLSALPV